MLPYIKLRGLKRNAGEIAFFENDFRKRGTLTVSDNQPVIVGKKNIYPIQNDDEITIVHKDSEDFKSYRVKLQ